MRKAALPIYSLASSSRGPTTTELPQEVSVEVSGKKIRFIDTPGILWKHDDEPSTNVADLRAKDILMRNKGRIDRLKDPASPGPSLIPSGFPSYFYIKPLSAEYIAARCNNEDLMLLYSLPAFSKGDCDAFLAGVARSNQLVKKVHSPRVNASPFTYSIYSSVVP